MTLEGVAAAVANAAVDSWGRQKQAADLVLAATEARHLETAQLASLIEDSERSVGELLQIAAAILAPTVQAEARARASERRGLRARLRAAWAALRA